MARSPFVNPVTGAPRRANKRSRSKNCRWMHLGAQEVGTRKIIQKVLARYSVSAMNSMFLSSYALILRSAFIGPIPIAMQQAIDYLLARANFYMHAVTRYTLIDNYLYDIPLTEWLYTREHCTRQHLCLGNLPDDRTAMKMTSFTIAQLQRWKQTHSTIDRVQCSSVSHSGGSSSSISSNRCIPCHHDIMGLQPQRHE